MNRLRTLRSSLLAVVLLVCLSGALQAETVLTMAGWGGTPDIAGFEKTHPGVTIKYQKVAGSYTFIQQAIVWAAGGSLPDIVLIPYWGIPGMADHGVLMDLSAFAQKDSAWVNSFFPGSLDAFKRNGKLYGIPWLVGPMTIVFNPAMFADRGMTTPLQSAEAGSWTMDTLAADAGKLTSSTPDGKPKTIGMYSRTDQMAFIAPLIWAYGGDILGGDGKTVLIDKPNSVAALGQLASLYSTEKTFLSNAQLAPYKLKANDVLYGPNTAMRLTWNVDYAPIHAAGIPVDMAPSPFGPGGAPTNLINAHGVGISPYTKHADLAWEYIKYALSEVPTHMEFPARQDQFRGWADNMQTSAGWNAYTFLQLVAGKTRLSPNPVTRDVEQIFDRYLGRALVGQVSPSGAAEEIQRLVQAQLQK